MSYTESYGNGTCWKPATPVTCRNTWAGVNTNIYFRAIDEFSDAEPGWMTGAQAAVTAWNNAPGPQFYSFTPRSNDTWVFLKDSPNNQNGLNSGLRGITWNCRYGEPCTRIIQLNEPVVAQWSELYFNRDLLDENYPDGIQNTFAHESGHAMMLKHNSVDSSSIMFPVFNPPVGGPNGNDTGVYPGCVNGGFAIRCIYGSGN